MFRSGSFVEISAAEMLAVLAVPLVLLFAGRGADSQAARGYQPAALGVQPPPPQFYRYPPPGYRPAYPPAPRLYPRRRPIAPPLPPPLPPRIIYQLPPPRPELPARQQIIHESADCGTPMLAGDCCPSKFLCRGPEIDDEGNHCGPSAVCCLNCDA